MGTGTKTEVAYIPGEMNIRTLLKNGKCAYFGRSKYQMRKEFPTIEYMTMKEALEKIRVVEEFKLCTNPKLITKEEYWEALEVLPPGDWCRKHGVETFHSIEFYTSDITSIYFKVRTKSGTKFYSCLNRVERTGYFVHIILNELEKKFTKELAKEC